MPGPVVGPGQFTNLVEVKAGGAHTCARTAAGAVWCWGDNHHGQIGNGGSTPTGGIKAPFNTAHITSGVSQVTAGSEHSCLRTTTGGARCWGRDDFGQLGVGATVTRFHPTDVIGLTTGVAAIEAGGKHTCALLNAGTVKCWGLNDYGALGDGTTTFSKVPVNVSGLSGVTAISVGGQPRCALTNAGAVKCWGLGSSGQLGNNSIAEAHTPVQVSGLTSGVAAIAAGGSSTCARMTTGALKCWGAGASGQVGDGWNFNRVVPTDVPGAVTNVGQLSVGRQHNCLRTTAGDTKCWGENGDGQLGDNTHTDLWGPFLPDPPAGVAAVVGDRVATVSWSAPASSGGAARRRTASRRRRPARVRSSPPRQLSVTISGLSNGTAYTFQVRATNSLGVSRLSSKSRSVTPAGLPGAPRLLGVATGDGLATVAWHSASNNGSALRSYKVVASPGGRSVTVRVRRRVRRSPA